MVSGAGGLQANASGPRNMDGPWWGWKEALMPEETSVGEPEPRARENVFRLERASVAIAVRWTGTNLEQMKDHLRGLDGWHIAKRVAGDNSRELTLIVNTSPSGDSIYDTPVREGALVSVCEGEIALIFLGEGDQYFGGGDPGWRVTGGSTGIHGICLGVFSWRTTRLLAGPCARTWTSRVSARSLTRSGALRSARGNRRTWER